jgi:uncharacterized protein YgbK (DUF1537 family)
MLAVGAAGFFEAILHELNCTPAVKELKAAPFEKPSLYICGTTFQKSRDAIRRQKEQGGPVSYLPKEIINADHPSEELYTEWSKEIIALLHQHKTAIIAIDPQFTEGSSAFKLREHTAIAVARVLQNVYVSELFLEGGSTAAAILRRSGITKFRPIQQLAPGVIRMQANSKQGLFFTVKPGSYDWPENIPIFHS